MIQKKFNKFKITVLIPTYNEDGTIIEILKAVSEQVIEGVLFEILVIDDGSTDLTVELLEKNSTLYTKLIKRKTNGGKGAAVKDGLLQATGDYILFQDADLEYDPAEYEKLLRPIIQFDADIVMGSRLIGSPCTRVSYFWHKVGNRLITFIFNVLNNTTFTDVYSCFLIYRRKLVNPKYVITEGWEQQAELLSRAVANADNIFEVPISYFGRTYDEGKKIKAHHAIFVIWTIFLRRFFK